MHKGSDEYRKHSVNLHGWVGMPGYKCSGVRITHRLFSTRSLFHYCKNGWMPHTASRPTEPLSDTYLMVRAVSMETTQATRQLMVLLHDEGYSVCDIARRCGVHRNTVHRWLRRHAQSGATNNLPRPGRTRCTTPDQDQVNNYVLLLALSVYI